MSRGYARGLGFRAIERLYAAAVEAARSGEYDYARLLVSRADEIQRVMRLPKPPALRRGACRRCRVPLIPGVTARYRLRRDGRVLRLVVTCMLCGYIHRYIVRARGEAG